MTEATAKTVAAKAAVIIYGNEGGYGSVNANDNGAVSVGKVQWHGSRALDLLKTIIAKLGQRQAENILGAVLYKEIKTAIQWSTRTVTATEKNKLTVLLTTPVGRTAQDELAQKDVLSYVTHGISAGLTDPQALIYFADLENQGGAGASTRVAKAAAKTAGTMQKVTLSILHKAALNDRVMGKYLTRRTETYKKAAAEVFSTAEQQPPKKETGGNKMAVKLSNCGHDERGRYAGGRAGDQTGTEYQIINWYSRPWKCVLRFENKNVAAMIADMAKKAALKVIENRNFELMTDYADLFMIDNNNNSETLFALQWVSNGTYGECNTIQDYFACESAITGNDRAWGGYVFAQPDVIWEYEKGDKRRQPTWMAYGDHYPEIQKANGGYTCEKKASGTVSGIYCKKYVCGSSKDNAKITSGSTPINTYMLRLAEVYLIYAEAILGNNPSTDDADAMEYFNKVRKRAGLEPQNSITYEDIRRERRLELCLEGQYWYDLVRRAYYKQQEVLNYITGQDRGTAIPVVWDADTQTLKRDEDSDETKRAIGDVDSSIFLLPYPESETVQNPLLKADPMPYAFKEDRITDLFN